MNKILILSTIPAPYRIAVFKGIAQFYDVTIYLEKTTNQERSPEWFEKNGDNLQFVLISQDDNIKKFYAEFLEIEKYDIVLCYEPFTKLARQLQNVCIKKKVKYIINADGALEIKKYNLKAFVKRYYVKRASLCFAGCQRAKEYFQAYGATTDKISIHNFTSLYKKEILDQVVSVEEKRELRHKYKVAEKLTFVSVGQFIYRKGFDVLLNAWEVNEDSQLIIIGGGSRKGEYIDIIKKNNLTNVFLYDFMPHDKLMDFYKLSDVFVLPTREDIWGLVINEALSIGLPIICSNKCTAGLELIRNEKNGFIYEVNDIRDLKNKIQYFRDNPEKIKVFSNASLKMIQHYNFENVIDSHRRDIDNLLGK